MMEYLTKAQLSRMAKESKTAALAEKVLGLQTSDKFRLAAELLDAGEPGTALTVGTRACQEIELATLFGKSARSSQDSP